MDRTEQIAAAVTRVATARLGNADPELLRAVVREVLAAVDVPGAPAKPVSTAPSPLDPTAAAGAPSVDNGDGTVTTPLGAVIGRPGAMPLSACVGCVEQTRRGQRNRAVVSATGLNRRGVIAALSTTVADVGGDIQDVSQTIVADYFTLIFVVDLRNLGVPFSELKQRISDCAEKMGIHAAVMHEDVMRALQRV